MRIDEWLKAAKQLTMVDLRYSHLSNEQWNKICGEYEEFCRKTKVKPNYDLFTDEYINAYKNMLKGC